MLLRLLSAVPFMKATTARAGLCPFSSERLRTGNSRPVLSACVKLQVQVTVDYISTVDMHASNPGYVKKISCARQVGQPRVLCQDCEGRYAREKQRCMRRSKFADDRAVLTSTAQYVSARTQPTLRKAEANPTFVLGNMVNPYGLSSRVSL